MKFNVDGVAQRCLKEAEIGEVLCDENREVKVVFYKPIRVED